MKTIHESRIARAARSISVELETENAVTVNVSTTEQDSHIFRVMLYLNRFIGKYWIMYQSDGTAIIRKQG